MRSPINRSDFFTSTTARRVFKAAIILVAGIFIFRLAQLQILQGSEYRGVSQMQAIKQVRIAPFRGNMYDRNGILIVHNEPSFSITITPYEFDKEIIPLLSKLIAVPEDEILNTLDKYKNYSPFEPVKILRDASFDVVSKIEENNDILPGVDVVVEPKRLYEFEGNMAHLLGYTREITRGQLEKYKYYRPGDIIGQSGLEQTYEPFLRGREGIQFVAVNKFGQKVSSFNNGQQDIPPNNGFDLYLTIDVKLQELAEKLLAGKRGAVVAIDPQNGEVLALASKPDYDPRAFSGHVPADLYKQLSEDPWSPLLHRAIQSQYPPGSTWKMLVGIAAMNEGIIDENTTIYCPGSFTFGNRSYKCHGAHGAVSLRNALKASCNVYFYQLGLKIGMENLQKYGEMFGFGQKTFIDLPNEKTGRLPTVEWLEKVYGKGAATRGRLVNYGIGQGEILVTPLQMAAYTAAIANEGTYYQPHLVRAIKNNISNKIEPVSYASRKLPIDKRIFKFVKDGMYDVVNSPGGTAYYARLDNIEVCGKTGTAQNPHGKDHAWFVCFAPKENPKIALVVLAENSGFGGAVAAPIAKQLLEAFFHPETFDKNKIYVPKEQPDNNQNEPTGDEIETEFKQAIMIEEENN
jgi:penicillin-binding protein 2